MKGWTMTLWRCACGQQHAPWWKTVQAPTCTAVRHGAKTYSEKVPR